MKPPHLLLAGPNPHKIKSNLAGILDAVAIQAIDIEIRDNTLQLLTLGEEQFTFANKLARRHWRQIVSRLYYAAYNTARGIRLFTRGEYSQKVTDHKKIENLPDDFPQRITYGNQLKDLRDDRNLCDYDHTATESDLILGREESVDLVTNFITEARNYLSNKGLNQQAG